MDKLWEKLDAKILTAGGGILLAGFLAYVLLKVLTNDLSHIGASIEKQAVIQQETNAVLREQTKILEANVQILNILERRIRSRRK